MFVDRGHSKSPPIENKTDLQGSLFLKFCWSLIERLFYTWTLNDSYQSCALKLFEV